MVLGRWDLFLREHHTPPCPVACMLAAGSQPRMNLRSACPVGDQFNPRPRHRTGQRPGRATSGSAIGGGGRRAAGRPADRSAFQPAGIVLRDVAPRSAREIPTAGRRTNRRSVVRMMGERFSATIPALRYAAPGRCNTANLPPHQDTSPQPRRTGRRSTAEALHCVTRPATISRDRSRLACAPSKQR